MLHRILAGLQASGFLYPFTRLCKQRIVWKLDIYVCSSSVYYPQWKFLWWHNYYHEIGYGMLGSEHFVSMQTAIDFIRIATEKPDATPEFVVLPQK